MFAHADVRETTLAPATEAALIAMIAPVGLFMIPLLFLIAGLLTPRSLERKGPAAFARDRLWRLGVPFAIYSFLLRARAALHPLPPARQRLGLLLARAGRLAGGGPGHRLPLVRR